jgi:hypothetical protein
LWPVLAAIFQIHPQILAAAQKVGVVPTHLESNYTQMQRKATRSWDLVYARAETRPYPLSAQLRNATVDWLAAGVSETIAQTAVDALQGKAGSGPPTAASWERTLTALVEANDPAAAMALLPTLGMFPDLLSGCRSGGKSAACTIVARLANYMAADPAVAAAFKMIEPHASGDTGWPAIALESMVAAQTSPLGRDPILGAVFANVVRSAGPAFQAQASAKGLTGDPHALISAAIQAYPYNPSWWLDLANSFIARYDTYTGLVLADVAMSLPMPEALRGNPMVADRQQRLSALVADYPAFTCCRAASGSGSPGGAKN